LTQHWFGNAEKRPPGLDNLLTVITSTPPQAAYIHVPFCRHRCGYCNFSVVPHRPDLVPRYLHAVEREIALRVADRPRLDSLFVGGGTPTQMAGSELRQFFQILHQAFQIPAAAEFSCEANPEDLSAELAAQFEAQGVNRVSLGVQSFATKKLSLLERAHDAALVRQGVSWLRGRVASLSIDLIFGAPGETLDDWRRDLHQLLELQPDHVSTYGLTFERGTRFWSSRLQGQLEGVAEEAELAMYELAVDLLTSAGYEHYEVSNFARPGHRCRHNEKYWLGRAFYGFGPGAARYIDGCRAVNHRSTTTYLKKIEAGDDATAEQETLAPRDRARERLVFGLRRLQGVSRSQFPQETGFTIEDLGGPALESHLQAGRLAWVDDHLRLTRQGLLVSDAMWPDFLEV
jgi:oxygen-independent coproporphyrinogen-3 oxidase